MNAFVASTLFLACAAISATAAAEPAVGQAAPAFEVTDVTGKAVSLSQFKGKHVVLEWVNPECPFVQKHYNSANMQATQKHATDKGVVWLTVQTWEKAGTKEASALSDWMSAKKAVTTATLVDSGGKLGRAYGAKTTPHMYIIDPAGKLVYAGAIDSKPTSNPADVKGATNYVTLALDESLAGKAVSQPITRPYGCSVKYGT